MAPSPLPFALSAAAAAAAGSAYLNARWSLEHDLLFFRIAGSALFNVLRALRADRLNAFYVLEKHALDRATADRPFLLFEGRACSYADAYWTVLRYGAWLRERRGVREGDVVALEFQNSDTFVLLWFAIWAVGARPAFINYHLQGAALTHCLRAATARLALVDPRVADGVTEDVRRELPDMEFVVFTPDVEAEARRLEPVRYSDDLRSEKNHVAMAMLIYTSGTTGLPKPAVVSWAKVYMAAMMASKGSGMRSDDVLYTVSCVFFALSLGVLPSATTSDRGCSACRCTTARPPASASAAPCFPARRSPSGVASRPRRSGRRCARPALPSSSTSARRAAT